MCVNIFFKYLCLLCSVTFVSGAILSQRFTLPRVNVSLINVRQEVSCSSIVACCTFCNQMDDCLTVSFKNSEGRCLLGTDRITHDSVAMKYVETKRDWLTMSKAVYTVFQLMSRAGRYKATYADAALICAEKDRVVASTTDLLASRSLGLDVTACGWLSNNKQGFVRQRATSSSRKFTTGVIWCRKKNKANVWCRL